MAMHLKERLASYFGLFWLIKFAVICFFQCLSTGFSGILDRTFAKLYSSLTRQFIAYESTTDVPRLITAGARGTVLELGPGSGGQLARFPTASIKRIYGAEPNAGLFSHLVDTALPQLPALKDIYVPINCGIEDVGVLEKHGVGKESLDSVVCMQVLCSVADPAEVVKVVRGLLKPGGEFVFWEHEGSGDWVTKVVQGIWNLIWTPLIGGCRLNRDIGKIIMEAGDWEVVEFERKAMGPWDVMPRVMGRLVKREA